MTIEWSNSSVRRLRGSSEQTPVFECRAAPDPSRGEATGRSSLQDGCTGKGARTELVGLRNMVARGGFCPKAGRRQRKSGMNAVNVARAAWGGGDSRAQGARFVAR